MKWKAIIVAAALLREHGLVVDVLPATIPENYHADAFVAIHADGNDDTSVSGYKVAPSSWDTSGRASQLSQLIEASYGKATGLPTEPNITVDMTKYYAFNYYKFAHSVNPQTPGVIVELGFLTNARDRKLITKSAGRAAQGVVDGIVRFLEK